MDKEKIILYANKLYQEALEANSCLLILEQYQKFIADYHREIQLSPAFYQIVHNSLVKSCFMEIAKLYESSQETVNIGSLLQECKNNIDFFPKYFDTITLKADGHPKTVSVKYQYRLDPEEKPLVKERCKVQVMWHEFLNIKEPVLVDLTFPEIIEIYQKHLHGLNKVKKNIQNHRNKVYAHNDKNQLEHPEDNIEQNSLLYSDMRKLVDFALKCTCSILAGLTGISPARSYSNINDWENTLKYVGLGIKYLDCNYEKQISVFAED